MNTTFWEKIQQGDEEAFRQLYNEYSDLLYGYGTVSYTHLTLPTICSV